MVPFFALPPFDTSVAFHDRGAYHAAAQRPSLSRGEGRRLVAPQQRKAIATWGDSLTAQRSSGDWPGHLGRLLGVDVYNAGVGSTSLWQIAGSQGARPVEVTVPGGVIPASGPVRIVASRYSISVDKTALGTIGGVEGTISARSFARSVPGAPKPVPEPTYFVPYSVARGEGRFPIIEVARNSATPADGVYAPVADHIDIYRAMVRRARGAASGFLIWQCPPRATEPFGSPERAQYDKLMDAVERAFPNNFVRIGDLLRTDEAARAAGVTWTVQDRADIAKGITPASFRFDGLHLNDAGGRAVAHFMARRLFGMRAFPRP